MQVSIEEILIYRQKGGDGLHEVLAEDFEFSLTDLGGWHGLVVVGVAVCVETRRCVYRIYHVCLSQKFPCWIRFDLQTILYDYKNS